MLLAPFMNLIADETFMLELIPCYMAIYLYLLCALMGRLDLLLCVLLAYC